jgi:MFS family permease
MAYVSSAMSMGLILGPVLGGILYSREGYYAAFALAFALIGLDLVLRVILVEKKIAVRYALAPHVLDEENPQSVKLAQLSQSPESSESAPSASNPPSSSLIGRKSRVPQVIRILKYPRLLVALFLSFVQALIMSAFDATLPLYLNSLFGFTALQAGSRTISEVDNRSRIHGSRATRLFHLSSSWISL